MADESAPQLKRLPAPVAAAVTLACKLCGRIPVTELLEPFGIDASDPLQRTTYRCRDKQGCRLRQTDESSSHKTSDTWDDSFTEVQHELRENHGSRTRRFELLFLNRLIVFKRNASWDKFAMELAIAIFLCESLFQVVGERGIIVGVAAYAFRELFLSLFIELIVAIVLKRVFAKD